jgi:hypothetical protein
VIILAAIDEFERKREGGVGEVGFSFEHLIKTTLIGS